MKKWKITMPAALLLVTLALGGCERAAAAAADGAVENGATETQVVLTESIDDYRARVAELESELRQLRQGQQTDRQPAAAAVTPDVGAAGMTFTYRVENGGATVTGYRGDTAFVQVPDTLDGYPVVKIGQRAFEGSDVTVVELPESVTEVDWFAFYGCAKLLYVTLPAGVERMGYAVFDECPRVTVLCEPGSYAERYADSYGLCTVHSKEG